MGKTGKSISLKGFLTVVAFILVVSATFVPHVAIGGVNAANAVALADLRNAIAAQESLYADYGSYGVSVSGAVTTWPYWVGPGWPLYGPLPAGTASNEGGFLITTWPLNLASPATPSITVPHIGISVSQDVLLLSSIVQDDINVSISASYIMVAKHTLGDSTYAVMSDRKRTIYVCKIALSVGVLQILATLPGPPPSPLFDSPMDNVVCGGTPPNPNWIPLP